MKRFIVCENTLIGNIAIAEQDGKIIGVSFSGAFEGAPGETALLNDARQQLTEYLNGGRRVFDLPLAPSGSDFEKAVWRELGKIPFGETKSYAQIALAANCPKGARAVGGACGKNPIPIFIPCHRVVRTGGALGGFSGGLGIKERLLALENCPKQ